MRIAVVGATGLVGSSLVAAARKAGHDVIAVSKQTGTDVLQADGLDQQLAGAEALVTVVQSPDFAEESSTAFFRAATANLAAAAEAAGVKRSVVLSIVGVDRVAATEGDAGTGFDGYYRAKYAQEQATLAEAPGGVVVRSTQFDDISGQAIGWRRNGDQAVVNDLRIQPVAVPAMVEVLLAAATGELAGPVIEVGGPQEEQMADMSTRYAAHVGDPVQVVAAPAGEAVRQGILLPETGAVLVGPTFAEWLETVEVPAPTA